MNDNRQNPDPDREVTVDEVRQRLEDAGFPPNSWGEGQERTIKVPRLQSQRKLLERIHDILEGQLKKDHETRVRLREALKRIEHGGGQ